MIPGRSKTTSRRKCRSFPRQQQPPLSSRSSSKSDYLWLCVPIHYCVLRSLPWLFNSNNMHPLLESVMRNIYCGESKLRKPTFRIASMLCFREKLQTDKDVVLQYINSRSASISTFHDVTLACSKDLYRRHSKRTKDLFVAALTKSGLGAWVSFFMNCEVIKRLQWLLLLTKNGESTPIFASSSLQGDRDIVMAAAVTNDGGRLSNMLLQSLFQEIHRCCSRRRSDE